MEFSSHLKNSLKNASPKSELSSNENGFILVLAPPLILLGFLTFSFLSYQSHNLTFREESRSLCRISMLSQQEIASRTIYQVMSLNPMATALNLQMKRLLVSLAAAIASKNAPAVAKITAEIKQVKEQQRQLHLRQKMLLKLGLSEIYTLQLRLQRDLLQISEKSKLISTSITRVEVTPPRIAIEPVNKTDTAPIYVFKKQFEESQQLSATWIETFAWKTKPHPKLVHKFKSGCEATLKQHPKQNLRPILKGDKFF